MLTLDEFKALNVSDIIETVHHYRNGETVRRKYMVLTEANFRYTYWATQEWVVDVFDLNKQIKTYVAFPSSPKRGTVTKLINYDNDV